VIQNSAGHLTTHNNCPWQLIPLSISWSKSPMCSGVSILFFSRQSPLCPVWVAVVSASCCSSYIWSLQFIALPAYDLSSWRWSLKSIFQNKLVLAILTCELRIFYFEPAQLLFRFLPWL